MTDEERAALAKELAKNLALEINLFLKSNKKFENRCLNEVVYQSLTALLSSHIAGAGENPKNLAKKTGDIITKFVKKAVHKQI